MGFCILNAFFSYVCQHCHLQPFRMGSCRFVVAISLSRDWNLIFADGQEIGLILFSPTSGAVCLTPPVHRAEGSV
jgi:hypothetical protein